MIRVAIAGIRGNMGRALACLIEATPDVMLIGGTVRPGSRLAGDLLPYRIVDNLECLLPDVDVVIDVSSREAALGHALTCVQAGRPIAVGVRGLDPNHVAELEEYSRRIPIFYSTNFCIEAAAVLSLLPALVERVPHLRIEVSGIDQHRRRQEVSVPGSEDGTALTAAVPALLDATDDPIVFLVGDDQEIMLSQRVYSREAHARGALTAARLISSYASGFFTMSDLIQHPAPRDLTGPVSTRTLQDEQLISHQR